jgi:hypothetical protein
MKQRRRRKRPWNVGTVAHLGGVATRERLTPEERRHNARRAAFARWVDVPVEARVDAARKAVTARWAAWRAAGKPPIKRRRRRKEKL